MRPAALFRNTFLIFASLNLISPLDPPLTQSKEVLSKYDLKSKKPYLVKLPRVLREVSGLAATSDGRIVAHNDENGLVFQIDPRSGDIMKTISVGNRIFRQDFEGIAVTDSLMFLVTSEGEIYEFREVADGLAAPTRIYSSGIRRSLEIEGLCYDPATTCLLLACKQYSKKSEKNTRFVLAYSLITHSLESTPRFVINVEEISEYLNIRTFNPTGIERHPESGSFIVLSSAGPAIIELSSDGVLLDARKLPGSVHDQPEGITFGPDNALYIANEGRSRGTLVRYDYDQ